jgi:Protein of unknown function (DUF2934)
MKGGTMTTTNREEAVQALAYKFWEEEGRPEGRAEAHWLRAVAEFKIPSLTVIQGDAKPSRKTKKR